MEPLEAVQLQLSLQEQQTIVIAVVTILGVMWLLRKQLAHLFLQMIKHNLDDSKHYIVEVIEKSIYNFVHYTLLTLIVYIVTIFLLQNTRLATVVNNIAVTTFLLTFFRLTYEMTSSITASSHRLQGIVHREVDHTLMQLVRLVVNGFILLLGVITIAQTWGISLTTVFAGLGIGGLALSLAAQDTIKNLIGFVTIVYDKPFTVEEYISIPTAEGVVEDIGLRSVKIRARDQSLVIVPNTTIVNEPVSNWSRLDKRWFNFVVALPFTTTAGQIETFTSEVREMLQGREHVESDSVQTLFTEYDSSALNILIRCYVTLPDYAAALAERMGVNLEINRIIDRLGLRLALPARYLTFDQVPAVSLPGQPLPDSPLHDEASPSGHANAKVQVAGDDGARNNSRD